jgi:hypothetical protein
LVSLASDAWQIRVENPKLVVEPGTGRTSKLAMVVYQF